MLKRFPYVFFSIDDNFFRKADKFIPSALSAPNTSLSALCKVGLPIGMVLLINVSRNVFSSGLSPSPSYHLLEPGGASTAVSPSFSKGACLESILR